MPVLKSIMYHYVRNPEETPYKGIHAFREDSFIQQVEWLQATQELASLESMLAYLEGSYTPKKDLYILTFDDGLKEHAQFVTSVLREKKIQGLFFIPTACIAEGYVLPVHKNHFLMASLEFDHYYNTFISILKSRYSKISLEVNHEVVAKTYRWDKGKVAKFKYILNYHLPSHVSQEVLNIVFEQELGSEQEFAQQLYINWTEAKEMQNAGMVLGGHSHTHRVLSSLSPEEQKAEIGQNTFLLRSNTHMQSWYPFSYPFGKPNTYNNHTITNLKSNGYHCAFSTKIEVVKPFSDVYQIGRFDPKDIHS